AELGINVQSFSARTQFVGSRCSTGGSVPCASTSQVRVLQGELNQQALYAFWPSVGFHVRYERVGSWWFADLAVSASVLFMHLENSGYTNFIAGETVAFSQTAQASGIDTVQDIVTVLPAITVRFGVKL